MVLIHEVQGCAAVFVAKSREFADVLTTSLGTQILSTMGEAQKRTFLKMLTVQNKFDERDFHLNVWVGTRLGT